MRKALSVFAALPLTLSGCEFSSLDPDAAVHISGQVLDASGRPLAGAQVLLVKQADIGEVVFGTVLAVGTLSTVCFLPDPPAICDDAYPTTADDNGRYEFELEGSDTQGTLGTESTMNVVVSGRAGTGSTTISFTAEETEISLPDARLWKAAARVSPSPGQIRLTWKELPPGAGDDAAYSAEVFESRSGPALWSEPASGGQAEIDPRLLEDRGGSVAVGAGSDLSGGEGAGDVRAYYLSARLPVRATAGAPPSRGRPCAAVTDTAPAADGRFSGCGATDGDLDRAAHLTGKGGATVAGVVIDLGSQRPVSLVVARGFSGQLLLEVSKDGRTYQTVGTTAGHAVAIRPQVATTARFIRLRSPTGLDQSLSAELSVW